MVPITVRPVGDNYEILNGHRRVESIKKLGQDEIEAIVEELTDEQAMIQGLAENIQRDDLDPIDEAKAYKRLKDEFGWASRRIGKEVGRVKSQINRMLALLNEPKEIQELVEKVGRPGERPESGRISETHVAEARYSGLEEQDKTEVLKKAAREGLTAKQTHRVADTVKNAPNEDAKKKYVELEFDTYKFFDYKEEVIDLLMRVYPVSVETMRIIKEMVETGEG